MTHEYLIFAYAAVLVGGVLYVAARWFPSTGNLRTFAAADGAVGPIVGPLTACASWMWGIALLVSSMVAYQGGIAFFLWFALFNTAGLVLVAFNGPLVRARMPNGYSLVEYMGEQYGWSTRVLYLVCALVSETYAVVVQITTAMLLLSFLGVTSTELVVVITGSMLVLALLRGVVSSVVADVVKMVLVIAFASVAYWVVMRAGGISVLATLPAKHLDISRVFDPAVVLGFGIPTAVSLLSAATIQSQLYQRVYTIRESQVRTSFLLGAVLFGSVLVVLGMLGALAAVPALGIAVKNPQLAGFGAIFTFAPAVADACALALLAALIITGTSALNAVGAVTVDFSRALSPALSDDAVRWIARGAMIVVTALGIFVFAKLTLLELLQAMGVRAAFLIPTLVALYATRTRVPDIAFGILAAAVAFLVLYFPGWFGLGFAQSKWGAAVAALAISGGYCVISYLRNRQ